jgi:hypothetical protein
MLINIVKSCGCLAHLFQEQTVNVKPRIKLSYIDFTKLKPSSLLPFSSPLIPRKHRN